MSKNIQGQSLPYEVLSQIDLNKIIDEKQNIIDTEYIIDYNAVFVTIFNDSTAVLSPPILGGEEGLLFYDIKAMHAMIASRAYPVKGTGSFWEKEKARIEHIDTSISYYCMKLSEVLDYKVEINSDPIYLKNLSNVINNKIKEKKQPKYLKEYLSIYIGEMIRQSIDGEWNLFIKYAFHIYYIPEVIKNGKSCDVVAYVFSELNLSMFIPFDIEIILNKAKDRFYTYNNDRYRTINPK